MRRNPDISHLLKPTDDIILTKIIPAITSGIKINQIERKPLFFAAKYSGLAIPIFAEKSDDEYKNSLNSTNDLKYNIIQ